MAFGTIWWVLNKLGIRDWRAIAVNADKSIIIASVSGNTLYKSTNQGVSWTSVGPSKSWRGVVLSSSGLIGYAVAAGEYIYKTTDGGDTWTNVNTQVNTWTGVTCSADGSKVVVVGSNYPYYSSDSGANWAFSSTAFQSKIHGVCCSTDGGAFYASHNQYVFKSVNYGATWSVVFTDTPSTQYTNIVCSADGSAIYTARTDTDGYIMSSTNSGVNWGFTGTLQRYTQMMMSSDGVNILASGPTAGTGLISTDSGATYSAYTFPLVVDESANIADGSFALVGGSISGYLYASTGIPAFSITSITPNTGSTAGGTPVTITGTGFDPAATAAIDGNNLTDLTVVDDTTITGITPAGTVGAKDVVVTNP